MSRHRTTAGTTLVLLATWALAGTAGAAVPHLIFPVVAKVSYIDDFGAPRWQGPHQGNDIMAAKRSPVVAVEGGRVEKHRSSSAGCMLYLYGRSGTTYMYIHLNNDRTLRNDNLGGCRNRIAYAPRLVSGQRARAGQLIGYVGDSGDANGIASHLHFELHPNGGAARSPYRKLRAAYRHVYARPPADVETLSMTVWGTVSRVNLDYDPPRIRVRIKRVRLSNSWVSRPARWITLKVPAEATIRRAVRTGVSTAATLDAFQPGKRVKVTTPAFRQWLRAARAEAGYHSVSDLLLRLDP
jgi:murein DD-endopeptidase MepM/ murein hydrolase activator NlpD